MLSYEFAEKRWCAFSSDDRFHILRDKYATLCGIGWDSIPKIQGRPIATKADWTQCAICAHEESERQEVWELQSPDGPSYNGTVIDGATGGPEE